MRALSPPIAFRGLAAGIDAPVRQQRKQVENADGAVGVEVWQEARRLREACAAGVAIEDRAPRAQHLEQVVRVHTPIT